MQLQHATNLKFWEKVIGKKRKYKKRVNVRHWRTVKRRVKMNKILMMSSEQVKKLKEILEDGGKIIRFITKDGSESVECDVTEVLFYNKANSKRKMKCVELDKVFPSIKETAKYFNCTPTSIRYAAKNKTKCRGYSFEYVVGE